MKNFKNFLNSLIKSFHNKGFRLKRTQYKNRLVLPKLQPNKVEPSPEFLTKNQKKFVLSLGEVIHQCVKNLTTYALRFKETVKTPPQSSPVGEEEAGLFQTKSAPQLGREQKSAFTLAEGATHVGNFAGTRKFAFTLAEVLITIGIIGVVAAMTIPNLIQKQQEKATVVKVQKAYSILSQAYLSAVEEYGDPSEWGVELEQSLESSVKIRDILLAKVKASVKCEDPDSQEECGLAKKYTRFNNSGTDAFKPEYSASIMTNDGLGIMVWVNEERFANRASSSKLSRTLGFVNVDINGKKAPNVQGKDFFLFYITDYGIIPLGTPEEDYSAPFESCYTSGRGCAAWVIKQKNMDYLHSDKCSWENTSCK